MKKLTIKVLLGIAFAMIPSFVHAGNSSGGGGDLCEIEYKALIPQVANSNYLFPVGDQVDATVLLEKLKSVRVECVSHALTIEGQEKTAVSDSKVLVTTVNSNRWMSGELLSKKALILHEGLVLLGFEKTNDYHLSDKVLYANAYELFPKYFNCEFKQAIFGEAIRVSGSFTLIGTPSTVSKIPYAFANVNQYLGLAAATGTQLEGHNADADAIVSVTPNPDADDYDLKMQLLSKEGTVFIERVFPNILATANPQKGFIHALLPNQLIGSLRCRQESYVQRFDN